MRTMQPLSYFLVAGALLLGSSCSSTNPDSASSTPVGASGTSSDATSGSTGVGTTTAGTPDGGAATTAGSSTSGSADLSGGAGGTSGTDAAADLTAFTATFATMEDPVFLMNAASSNLLEIQTGQMAAQKASNAEVRQFAQMMVSHHTTATQQLKAIAAPLGVTLPQTMMPVHQALADRLRSKSGKGFDETYMDLMETAHKTDIAMFEVKSKKASTPNVQDFATKTLPLLRSHYTMADELEKKVD